MWFKVIRVQQQKSLPTNYVHVKPTTTQKKNRPTDTELCVGMKSLWTRLLYRLLFSNSRYLTCEKVTGQVTDCGCNHIGIQKLLDLEVRTAILIPLLQNRLELSYFLFSYNIWRSAHLTFSRTKSGTERKPCDKVKTK